MNLRRILRRDEDENEYRAVIASWRKERFSRLGFSNSKIIRSSHKASVAWLDLDHIENRYLLACAADSTIAAYDILAPSAPSSTSSSSSRRPSSSSKISTEHKPLFTLSKPHPDIHHRAISSIAWYTIDNGMFASAGRDGLLKIWNTNTLQVESTFTLDSRIFTIAMSSIALSHCLIAAGSDNAQVQLCDILSGGCTHRLTGHRGPVWALAWSVTSEWELLTGGQDGQLRLWDIRRAGTTCIFDMHSTFHETIPSPASNVQGDFRRDAPATKPSSLITSHDGGITGVAPTSDGLHWLSAGKDDTLRLWDARTHKNELVHYRNAYNRASTSRQLAVSEDGAAVFYPSGSAVQVFDTFTGETVKTLGGVHFESINSCVWNPLTDEVYTGSNDSHIAVWSPQMRSGRHHHRNHNSVVDDLGNSDSDQDAWSD